VAKKINLWNLHITSKTYGTLPSHILHIYDQWAAYCLDSAVSYFGNYVESKTSELDDRGKPKYSLDSLLSHITPADQLIQPAEVVKKYQNFKGLFEVIEAKNGK
jgi:hypothetical protein